MAEKRRYTVSLPEHVAGQIENLARIVGAPPTEYVADVVRWWFGQGCPPVTPDENRLRGDVNAWNLDPAASYVLTNDDVVQKLMNQLGVPNLFAGLAEHDQVHSFVAFENHPTHWLTLHLWKGSDRKDGNGLLFSATPKSSKSRAEVLAKLEAEAKEMGAPTPVSFSQLPSRIRSAETPPKMTIARKG